MISMVENPPTFTKNMNFEVCTPFAKLSFCNLHGWRTKLSLSLGLRLSLG